MTTYIDGHLLGLADGDDREAVRVVAAIARDRLGPLVGDDDALGYALRVLERLARGETVPTPARQRPLGHLAYEKWAMAQRVGDVMREDGLSETAALVLVARAALKPGSHADFKQYRDGALPPDLYPIPPDAEARLAAFEDRLAVARKKPYNQPRD